MSLLASEPAVIQLDFTTAEVSGQVVEYLRSYAPPVHLVGGTVRDLILGRVTHDLDVTVEHDALALARQLANVLGGAFVPMDVARDTGRVVFSRTLAKPVVVDCAAWRGPTLEDDLRHRDFSVNALAVPITDTRATVIDVTGGLGDLRQGLIRLAYDRSLADDPLRGLRAVRLIAELSSFGFRLERGTEVAIRRHAPMLVQSSPERVRDELVRVLSAEAPDTWLRLMAELDQLAVVLPELAALRNVQRWDAFGHTLATLHHASTLWRWVDGAESKFWPTPEGLQEALEPLRIALAGHLAVGDGQARNRGQMWMWAILAQNWGWPEAQDDELADRATLPSQSHRRRSAQLVADVLRRLRFNEAEVRRVARIVAHHLRPLELVEPGDMPGGRMVHRYFQATGDAGVEVALTTLADRWSADEPVLDPDLWRWHVALVASLLQDYFTRRDALIEPQPLVDGNDLVEQLGLQPGRWIGYLLAEVAEAQAAGELDSREEALALASSLFRSLQSKS